MTDVLLALLAIAAGAVFCFRGYLTMRIVIPIWGAFVGFAVGAGALAAITGDGFLANVASWIAGVVVAAVFSALAYLYYEVSITITMAGVGFLLGASVMVALNITWSWLIVLVGVMAGVSLAAFAIVGNLPMVVLTVLTATGGSTAIVGGLMLLTDAIDASDLDEGSVVARIQDDPAWWLLYALIAVLGVGSQLKALRARRDDGIGASVRQQWRADGGNELRPLPPGPTPPA
jgi:hypothetical protein